MKRVRLLLLGGVALLVLALGAVAVAFNSTFQTWLARKALAAQPGMNGTLGALAAGLNRVELADVRIESQGAVLTLPALEADLPLVPAGLNKNVQIRRLVAHGWTLDLTHARNAGVEPRPVVAAAAAGPIIQGAFARLHLPVDLSVGELDLAGVVVLPAVPNHPAARVSVTVRGGGLAVSQEGHFTIDIAGTSEDGTFNLHSEFAATMDTPRSFGRLAVASDAAVRGPRFPQGVKLNSRIDAQRTPAGETYHLALADGDKTLADVQADYTAVGSRVAGRWKVNLHDTDLAPFALGREFPVFTATGEGGFETDATFAEIHATGRLDGSADKLSVLRSELAAVGAIKVSADFDVLQHGDSFRVERLNAILSGAQPVLTVHALQSFEFNARTAGLSVADPAQDLLWLSLQGVPLAWARPFLSELALSGDGLRGEIAASARNGGLTLRSKSPLALSHLGVSRAGAPLLKDVDVSASLSADYAPKGWQISVPDFTARCGGATLAALDLKAGQLAGKDQPLKAAGHWSANLPALLAQPVAAGPVQLADGTAQGELTASIGPEAQQFQLRAVLANLVTLAKETLPTVTADLRVDLDRAGKVTFSAPLLFERAGRKSDLALAGTLTHAAAGLTVDARLTGDSVVVEDVQLIAAPLASSLSKTPPPSAPPAVADTVPFWHGVSGQVALALKKIVYASQFQVNDITGVIRVGEGALRLEGVHAGFGADSDLKLNTGITFTSAAPAPYALTADIALLNFDAAPAFRALDPTKPPTIEGRINLASRLSGGGKNLADLAARVRGEMELTSKGGLFRALNSDIAGKVEKTKSTVAALGGVLSAVTGRQSFDNLGNKAQILTDITKSLAEIPFDQLSVSAARDDSLNVLLKDFTLISPEVRLGGGGRITYAEGVPLLAQTLNVELNLAARGRLGDLMKRAGLLDTKQDALGYTAFMMPLKIGGTLAHTDTTELRNAILNSALEKSGLFDALLGK